MREQQSKQERQRQALRGLMAIIIIISSILFPFRNSLLVPVVPTLQQPIKISSDGTTLRLRLISSSIIDTKAETRIEIHQDINKVKEETLIKKEKTKLEDPLKNAEKQFVRVTFYCACRRCCSKSPSNPNYGITASGVKAQSFHTIAMKGLPFGTKVYIPYFKKTFIVEDRGVGYGVIDFFVGYDSNAHQRALNLGVLRNTTIYILK